MIKENEKIINDYLCHEKNAGHVKSDNTVRYYNRVLCEFTEHIGSTLLTDATHDMAVSYMESLSIADTSVNLYITTLKKFYTVLVDNGKIAENPFENLRKKATQKVQRCLSDDEIQTIMDCIEGMARQKRKMKAFVHLLITTGLRISEILSIRYDMIQRFEVNGKIYGNCIITGKGDKQRSVPILPTVLQEIDDYWYNERPVVDTSVLFLNEQGRIWHQTSVNRTLKTISENAGIDDFKNVHAHTFRHSFASKLINNGQDLVTVKELMGHSNISTTQRYIHVSDMHKKNVIESVFD